MLPSWESLWSPVLAQHTTRKARNVSHGFGDLLLFLCPVEVTGWEHFHSAQRLKDVEGHAGQSGHESIGHQTVRNVVTKDSFLVYSLRQWSQDFGVFFNETMLLSLGLHVASWHTCRVHVSSRKGCRVHLPVCALEGVGAAVVRAECWCRCHCCAARWIQVGTIKGAVHRAYVWSQGVGAVAKMTII